jgi:hypothetical protein
MRTALQHTDAKPSLHAELGVEIAKTNSVLASFIYFFSGGVWKLVAISFPTMAPTRISG